MDSIDPKKFTFDFSKSFLENDDVFRTSFGSTFDSLREAYFEHKAPWETFTGQDKRWQARYYTPEHWVSDKFDTIESTATHVRSEDVEHNPLKDEYDKLRQEVNYTMKEAHKRIVKPPLFDIVDVEWEDVDDV